MTPSQEFDTWADWMKTATGLDVTRDPAQILPPCVYVDMPTVVGRTLAATRYQVSVFLVAGDSGKDAGDWLLDNVDAWLTAIEEQGATPRTLTIGDVSYPTMHATKTVTMNRKV